MSRQNFFDSGYHPLGPRAYEVAEEKQRFEESRISEDCSFCTVHPTFMNGLCVHCYYGKTGPTKNNLEATNGEESK